MYRGFRAPNIESLVAGLNKAQSEGFVPAQFFPQGSENPGVVDVLLVKEIPDPRIAKLKEIMDRPELASVLDTVIDNMEG